MGHLDRLDRLDKKVKTGKLKNGAGGPKNGQKPGNFVTAREAADLIAVSPRTIVRMLAEGGIVGFKTRGAWKIPRAQFFGQFPFARPLHAKGKRK